MAPNVANKPRFLFGTPDLPDDELEVVDFVGREAISQAFRFELNLVSKNPSVPFSDLVDRRATLTMTSGAETSYVHGVVADFQQGSPVGDYFRYRAVLVPRLWRLALTFQSRVFQHLSVPEIVRKVLEGAGFGPDDFRFALAGSYPPREYCTQYKETDLAFISRLLEFEGIQFFFVHQAEREVLVLTDDRSENPPIEGDDDTVTYRPAGGMAPAHEETVREFIFQEQMVTGRVILKDYNYRTPEADLRAESQISDEMPGVYYEYGPHIKDADAASRIARVRNEEIECRRRVGSGEGTCLRLRAGHHFTLDRHYRLDLNQPYIVTEITHHGTQRGAVNMQIGEDRALSYHNSFACIPAVVPYRPPRVTPVPRLPGIMTAKVESGGGEYAYLDDEGRYRIKMPFDLAETEQAGASKPIRLAQPYTGADYGMHFPVHADAEMVFACVDGDVDRPLGLSTVPNPAQGSPVRGENHTRNVIRTASQNEIYMEDEKGNERIKIESPYKSSILQLGSPNVAADGVCVTTDGATAVHGKEGVFVSAWGSLDPSQSLAAWKAGLSVLDGSIGVVAALLGLRPFSLLSATNLAGSFSSLAMGVLGQGVYITAPHGVGLYSSTSVSAVAGSGGVGLYSAAGTDICSLAGVYLGTVAGGVHIGAAQGGVKVAAGQGDIEVGAKTGAIRLESDKEVKLRSMNSDIRLLTLKDNKILLQSRNLIRQEARKDIELESQEGQVGVKAKKDVIVESTEGGIGIGGKGEVVVGSESDAVTITGGGGGMNAPSVLLSGKYITLKADQEIRLQVGSGPFDPKIVVGKTGISMTGGATAQVNIQKTGAVKILGTQLELIGRALAKLQAALSKIG